VGDADGVVVVPRHLAAEVALEAAEQERQERFIAEQVAKGEPIDGLYPIGKRWQAAYLAWLADKGGNGHEVP
jgi:regulator of RNase E activity RraA